MNTFSFDYTDNDKFFKSNSFQPEADRPWVDKMVKQFNTKHHYLVCDIATLADNLYDAVRAKDLPGMADVDSSLLFFCKEVKKDFKVALSGECADEIFGGYPWFHNKEAFDTPTFPWSRNTETRKMFLTDDFSNSVSIDEHIKMKYEKSIQQVPKLEGENPTEARRREIAYLNIKWFMTTLLDRKDRMSMNAGLEARVPYADHRILEYVFNIPWEMKCKDGLVKSLLRDSSTDLLPHDLLYRKKSPYPKTHNPLYEKIVGERLRDVISNPNAPILSFIDKKAVTNFIDTPSDYGKPFFGQLMAGPQLMAYLLQVNYWLDYYKIEIV